MHSLGIQVVALSTQHDRQIALSTSLAVGLDLSGIPSFVSEYGWWAIFALMFLQGAAMPVPNEVTMPLAGWLLIAEPGLPKAYIAYAGLVGAAGWALGAVVAYTVMALGGYRLLNRLRARFPAVERALARSDAWFARWGAWAGFFSRLLPISRTIITLPAGAARVPLIPFTVATFAGAFIWSTVLAALGYAAGSQWSKVRERVGGWYLPLTIAAIFALAIAYIVAARLRECRASEGRGL